MSFQTWYDNADMPEKDENGRWYDLEDGIEYDPDFNYSDQTFRKKLSSKALENRQKAKFFGGKALRGTVKQKEWAEKIRWEKICSMSDEIAELICDPNGLCTHSKFWIENREKSASEFENYIIKIKTLLKKFNALDPFLDIEKREIIANEYNELTTIWNGVE